MLRRLMCWTVLILLAALTSAAAGAAPTADLYVAPVGNDAWTGKLGEPNAAKTDGPLATVGRAQQRGLDLGKQRSRVRIACQHPPGGSAARLNPVRATKSPSQDSPR